MGKRIIEIDIELTKIDKSKIKVKDGRKFYKMAAIETNGKYGQWMIVESQSKEEKELGKRSTILGNGKNKGDWGVSSSDTSSEPSPNISSDDLSF